MPHVLALLHAYGGRWMFAAPDPPPVDRLDPAGSTPSDITVDPVTLDPDTHRLHYGAMSLDTLQWTFHYLHDTVETPVFGREAARAWRAYEAVNAAFAERLHAAGTSADDTVLICDYHLLLVPGLVARDRRHRGAALVYSHGVPWCGPGYFALLPHHVRVPILESLLSCQAVVFHCHRWREAFLRCCERDLAGVATDGTVARYRGNATSVVVAPFPLDVAQVKRVMDEPETAAWRQRYLDRAGGRRILARADRLDLWKNHIRGFLAYDDLLSTHEGAAGELCFLAVATPPRHLSPRHERYARRTEELVQGLNARWSRGPGMPAVEFVNSDDRTESRNRAIAALQVADSILINPTYDGLNMVAMESLCANPDAPIVLSRLAGVHEMLEDRVLSVNPFDVVETSEALAACLLAGDRPDPGAVSSARQRLEDLTATQWMEGVLAHVR